MSSCTFNEWREMHHRTRPLLIISTVIVLTLLVIFIITGNLMVIFAVLTRRRLRTATGMLILSLAVADLLVCLLSHTDDFSSNFALSK
ncbi:unnamed protein product [Gongylonema pulchrum]|uniref:G_PROTEIN_RECEP_F1_2 domain-containing protein n=1 Tax=Gongylonema pulchrum TaxID=637853 RepID=A0A183EZB0_9BILA|nr:unnamed protein product [Gongylonema pulchrum]